MQTNVVDSPDKPAENQTWYSQNAPKNQDEQMRETMQSMAAYEIRNANVQVGVPQQQRASLPGSQMPSLPGAQQPMFDSYGQPLQVPFRSSAASAQTMGSMSIAATANTRGTAMTNNTEGLAMLKDDGEGDEDDDTFKPITEIKVPEFVDIFFALTGVSDVMYKVERERNRRSEEGYQNPYLEIEEIVLSQNFEVFIGAVIVFNCILIGWQASLPEGELGALFNVFEHCFTLLFFVEWCSRMLAFGWAWAFEPLNAADSALVFGTGVLLKWVAEPAGFDLGNFRILTVLRAFRLVRLARTVRLKKFYKELWVLIKGLTTSARLLMWTMTIAFCVFYVFAIAAVEFIAKNPDFNDDEYAHELFGNFLRAMFTFVQMVTMDTYCDLIIRPLMATEPMLAIFFIIFITLGVFVLMNLVTAVIVENAFNIVHEDKDAMAKEEENKKRRELKQLSALFMEIDTDGSGELSRDEFFHSLHNANVKRMLDTLEMKVIELEETWEVLDDGDGLLTIKEFTDGIRRMKGEAKAKDIADVIKNLRTTDRKHMELKEQAQRYSDTLHALERDADQISTDAREVATLFKEMYHRLSSFIAKGEKQDKRRVREHDKLARLAEEMHAKEMRLAEEDGESEEISEEDEVLE